MIGILKSHLMIKSIFICCISYPLANIATNGHSFEPVPFYNVHGTVKYDNHYTE